MQSRGAGMNEPYLEKRSTTSITEPQPSNLGWADMKSIETLSHGLSGIGKGSNNPADTQGKSSCRPRYHPACEANNMSPQGVPSSFESLGGRPTSNRGIPS